MKLPRALIPLALGISAARGARGVRDDARGVAQGPLNFGASSAEKYAGACPDYKQYAASLHQPFSEGPMKLPYQRPSPHCRTFTSPLVERVILDITTRMVDKDLARIFENAFPNTLDTTIRWHSSGASTSSTKKKTGSKASDKWVGPQSFIVTGDIDAEWLRDSTNQLSHYQSLARNDPKLSTLILGAINTQAEFVIESPYCNAFQPPPPSRLSYTANGQIDNVHPTYEPNFVFECKYELDSLAHFLALSNKYHNYTKSTAFLTPRWYLAIDTMLAVIDKQSEPTFDSVTGRYLQNEYTFQRQTTAGTETLNLGGIGNPLANGTGLIRSAFRPSDDATIFGFYIPANAMMAVELLRTAAILRTVFGKADLATNLKRRGEALHKAVWEHGVVKHKRYGEVFAYEVDGYGSQLLMDDANLPSLLALPAMGFLDRKDETYQRTRKMLLEKEGNPYYLRGPAFSGIGGPHVGLEHAWPMSLLLRALTSDEDQEIMDNLNLVRNASLLGLIHESISVVQISSYTRSWFAWANALFGEVILDVAARKPHLIFGEGAEIYTV